VATVQESVDDIRRQMAEIRSDLHRDMSTVVEGASSVTDWRSYLRDRPWMSLGAAFALGYVLVPRRARPAAAEPISVPLAAATIRAEPPARRQSLAWRAVKTIAAMALPVAARAAQGYAVRWVEGFLAEHPPGPDLGGVPPDLSRAYDPRSKERFGYPTRG